MNAAVQRIRAEGDPTEALAAEFDDADERLSELEEARAEVEGEVADLDDAAFTDIYPSSEFAGERLV